MSNTLEEIAQKLKDSNNKVNLIYAFNGTGKTRLSRIFKKLVFPKSSNLNGYQEEMARKKILYYNAFTEDLLYWDNDLNFDKEPKLKIHNNSFTKWILEEQGQDQNVIKYFQKYTDEKLTPKFNKSFSEVTFSFTRGNKEVEENIKISKGEESNFIWSIFYSLLDSSIGILNIPELEERETDQFNDLEYVFIDDPVSSLDENHLIELAVDLATLIKSSESELKFVITTHNPLFYNVLFNEFSRAKKYILKKKEDNTYDLIEQGNDSPFAYHLYLKNEIENAIKNNQVDKRHFNYMRNILEKTSTFLGYNKWGDLIPPDPDGSNPTARAINIFSHSKYSTEELGMLSERYKAVLENILKILNETYRFK